MILVEIDHSLRRLGVDYVDLYQIHHIDNASPLEETLETLHDVVTAGNTLPATSDLDGTIRTPNPA